MKGRIIPQTLPWPIRWKVDFDYLDTLPKKEMSWLSEFVTAFYDGDFRGLDKRVWYRKRRLAAWEDKRVARRSTVPGGLFRDLLLLPPAPLVDEPVAEGDLTPTDAYLDSAEYKHARNEFRSDPSDANRRRLEMCTGRGGITDAESWALRDFEAWIKKNCP